MYRTTHPSGQEHAVQTPTATRTAGGEDRRDTQKRYRTQAVLWAIGLIVFAISCFTIHFHPTPYPIDLWATHSAQAEQPHLAGWLQFLIALPSIVNDPVPSALTLAAWVVMMLVVGLVRHLRKLPSLEWFLAAVGLAVAVMSSAAVNVLLDIIIGRPRPDPHHYHFQLHTPLVPFPTYPSGHTEHDVVYYGFLLYLSFTKPVREWKYHWLLLPLQIYAVFDIIDISYSRIYEGDHWLTDVLGGYLEGVLLLFFFIFLYRFTTNWFAKRRQRKEDAKTAGVYVAHTR